MNFFAGKKVSTRLILGFAAAMALLALVGLVGVLALQNDARLMTALVDESLVKERLIREWHGNTNTNGARSVSVAMIADAKLRDSINAHIKETSARISDIQKQLETLPISTDEKAMYDAVAAKRKEYLAFRDQVAALKKDGKDDEARDLYLQKQEPALGSYLTEITRLDNYQAAQIREYSETLRSNSRFARLLMAILSGAAILVGMSASWLIIRSLTTELGGEPADAVDVASRIAQGDLTVQVPVRAGDQNSLMAALSAMRDKLAEIVGQVRTSTEAITQAASEIASGTNDLSIRTEQQADSLSNTARSMGHLTEVVRRNGESALQANRLTQNASGVATKGGTVVARVVTTMNSINSSSHKIVDIISVIDSIAFQTNILALNAAVEAARAGEQGRGFAVVAAEVRNLAQRSAGAAKEIKALIGASVGEVEAGSKLVAEAGETMHDIVDSVQRVTDIMVEITEAGREQSSGIEQINAAIVQMDTSTQQNAALVEQAAAAAESMKDQAARLDQLVGVFRTRRAA